MSSFKIFFSPVRQTRPAALAQAWASTKAALPAKEPEGNDEEKNAGRYRGWRALSSHYLG